MRVERLVLWRLAMNKPVAALFFAALTLVACNQPNPPTVPSKAEAMALTRLQSLGGCADVEATVRARAIAEMEKSLDANLAMATNGSWCWGYAAADGLPTPGTNSTTQPRATSTTNNQVAGVDEADLMKTEGEFLYVLGAGKLNILNAWPAASAHVVSRTPIAGTPRSIFVEHGRAVVFSSLTEADAFGRVSRECTYGYDCDFTGDGLPLQVTVLDLADKAHPVVLREVKFSGSLIATRRIGDAVHLVVSSADSLRTQVQTWPDNVSMCGAMDPLHQMAARNAFEALRVKNRELLNKLTVADLLPSIVDVRHEAGGDVVDANLLASCGGFYGAKAGDGMSFLSLASFDLSQSAPVNVTTVIGRPGAVYASADSLYVATRHQSVAQSWYGEPDIGDEATTVHRFAFQPGPSTAYQGSGIVKGRALNQFSMDEYDGHFRIATTTGHLPSTDVHSTISVLEQRASGLETVGSIDHLAPGEDIRSARFEGSKAYVVTFKKTDPLFVFDLSQPTAPRLEGELKIPGFSTYLHLVDPTHLLAIGYDADDQGSFAWFQGVLLQLFDVSNPANPTMSARYVIGTRGSSSEALTNHLAFNYFADRQLLAVPMTVCEQSQGGGSYGQNLTFGGLMVFGVQPTSLDYRGGVPHAAPQQSRSACSNWWTQATSQVKRSVFMDDYVYSIAQDLVQVANVNALGSPLVSLTLE
jgi:uncharacterized secreted protein with C-terminal beta-propeller domain